MIAKLGLRFSPSAPPDHRLLVACAAAFLPACSVLIPAIAIYGYNSGEFTFLLSELLGHCAAVLLILFLLFLLPLLLLRRSHLFSWISSAMLALSIAIWLQHLLLAGNLEIYHSDSRGFTWVTVCFGGISLLTISSPFLFCLSFRHWCLRHYLKLSVIVLLPQLLPLIFQLLNYSQPQYDFYDYSITEQDKATFARQGNVLVIVVDCLGEYLFKEIWREYPEMRASFRDFTCFDRMLSPKPSTNLAVPAILTGHEFPGSFPNVDENLHANYLRRACHSPESLFVNFKRAGYRCEGYPFILQTISYSPALLDNVSPRVENLDSVKLYLDVFYQRLIPFFLKPWLNCGYLSATEPFITPREETLVNQNEVPQDLLFYRQLRHKSKVGDFDYGFKYLHFQGGHTAIVLNEKLEISHNTDVKKQMRASFLVLETLLEKLRQFDLYEQSLIVITGDHSERYTPEIVTLIKRPGDSNPALVFNSLPCEITDIAPSVLSVMGLAPAEHSLFSRPSVLGSAELTHSSRPETLNLGEFQPQAEFSPSQLNYDQVFNQPYEIENLNLILKQDCDLQNRIVEVSLLASNLQSQQFWQTVPKQAGTELGQPYAYQVELQELPEGNYLLFLLEKTIGIKDNDDDEEEEDFLAELFPKKSSFEGNSFSLRYFPQFLLRDSSGFSWSLFYPGLTPRALGLGERVFFQPMQPYPALRLPKDSHFSGKGLRLPQDSILGVLLPSEKAPLHLHLKLTFLAPYDGFFEIFHHNLLLYRQNCAAQTTSKEELRLTLPKTITDTGNLEMQFRLRKKYPNRTLALKPKFHLESLFLEE